MPLSKSLNDLMGYISVTKLFDFLPLDLTLHCLIGAFITIFALHKGLSLKVVFFLLVGIAGLKELNDYFFHYRSDWQEYASDFAVTFVYIFIIFIVRLFKNRKPKAKKIKMYGGS